MQDFVQSKGGSLWQGQHVPMLKLERVWGEVKVGMLRTRSLKLCKILSINCPPTDTTRVFLRDPMSNASQSTCMWFFSSREVMWADIDRKQNNEPFMMIRKSTG